MKLLYIDATTEHNETNVSLLDSVKDAFEMGCETLEIECMQRENLTPDFKDILKNEGKLFVGDEYDPSVEARYDETGSIFGTPVFTLQVWRDDVLERYNITIIEMKD